jgi:hypothetical protein
MGIAWYDNILLVGKNEATVKSIRDILNRVIFQVGAIVKDSEQASFLASLGKQDLSKDQFVSTKKAFKIVSPPSEGWTLTENEVEYMGILWRKAPEGVYWKHIGENIDEWTLKLKYRPQCQARQAAEIIGVLLWDHRVAGTPLAILEHELDGVGKWSSG